MDSQSDRSKAFYRRALSRLTVEEREKERSRDIPYALSLSALGGFFYQTAERLGWLGQKNPIVLAVSGGSDSIALLWFFRTFHEGKIIVAHLEHGIRGAESKEDALFVEEMAARWGIETEICHADVPGRLDKGESLELAARRIRYAFLTSVAEKNNAFGVALGHNKEDVAETVLFNLLRGAGVRGVAGIPRRRGIFFRPLLGCSRYFLRKILLYREILWREDRTNADSSYTRNFIRNELMPQIEQGINRKAVDHLVAFAEEMRYYREEEELYSNALFESAGLKKSSAGWVVDRGKLHILSVEDRAVLIRKIGRHLEIPTLSRERTLELVRLTEGKGCFEFQWGKQISVSGNRDQVCWILPIKGVGE